MLGPAPTGDVTGATDTANLLAAIAAAPVGAMLLLWAGSTGITSLSSTKSLTIQGVGWNAKRDGLLLFGHANYLNNT